MVWIGNPSRIRMIVIAICAVAWVLNFFAPFIGLQADPGLGVAFFGVMGAAIAIPYTDQERKAIERRKREEDKKDELYKEWRAAHDKKKENSGNEDS